MQKYTILLMAVSSLALAACGDKPAPAADETEAEESTTQTEFDEQLSEEEANAALDALDAEEAAQQ